jgi:hypothetical protein
MLNRIISVLLFDPPKPAGAGDGSGREANKQGNVSGEPNYGMYALVAAAFLVILGGVFYGGPLLTSAPTGNGPSAPSVDTKLPAVATPTATPAATPTATVASTPIKKNTATPVATINTKNNDQRSQQNSVSTNWDPQSVQAENNRALKNGASYRAYQVADIPQEITISRVVISNLQINTATRQISGSVKYSDYGDKVMSGIQFKLYPADRTDYGQVKWRYPIEGKTATDMLKSVDISATYSAFQSSKSEYVVMVEIV